MLFWMNWFSGSPYEQVCPQKCMMLPDYSYNPYMNKIGSSCLTYITLTNSGF
jgi:hypothetical protein